MLSASCELQVNSGKWKLRVRFKKCPSFVPETMRFFGVFIVRDLNERRIRDLKFQNLALFVEGR